MRSVSGDGYQLTVYTGNDVGDGGIEIGPGLGLVYRGTFTVNGVPFAAGTGFETNDTVTASTGSGILAVAEHIGQMPIPTGGVMRTQPPVVSQRNWGYEMEVPSEAKLLQLKFLHVMPGHRTSLQYHRFKDEAMIFLDGSQQPAHYQCGVVHRVGGPAYYVEASTYHPDDVVRIADDYGRAPKEPAKL